MAMKHNVMAFDEGPVRVIRIERPGRRNAVDLSTAQQLVDSFRAFDSDPGAAVAVLTGAGESFCAGADLQAIADGERKPILHDGDFAPMGPTRLKLGKPVIAAIEGAAVAGGMELAIWCDLRVVSETAFFGVFCRRFGVPLVDLGTVRLPRLIGHSRAMDLILTGREVGAAEAIAIGLAHRVVAPGQALAAAVALARALAALPQACLRSDRLSAIEQWELPWAAAVRNEIQHGLGVIGSGETLAGAVAFTQGAGRHGQARASAKGAQT
jgi:enoyl-CoA hydratase